MKIHTLRPLTAIRAVRDLFANPNDTQYVFEIIDALQGPALMRMRNRLRRSEQGRRLLSEQPDLLPLLNDRESLRRLPEGSLGRAYLAFVEAEGISANGLVGASELSRQGAEAAELRWIRDWLRDTHDLWHAVLGYQGDLVGEAALLAFSHHETRNMGVGMIATVACFKLGRLTDPAIGARHAIAEGRRRAKHAAWFVGVPWHRWLARPVEEVRRELGVEGIAQYTPVRSHEVDVSLVA
ncbi:MAG: Coq4 family protein [Polyangiales bacterium]